MRRTLALVLTAALATGLAAVAPAGATVILATSPLDAATAAAGDTATVLVRFQSATPDERAAAHAATGGTLANRITPLRVDVVRVPAAGVDAAIAAYSAMPLVRYAEPDRVVHLQSTPNDDYQDEQYALTRINARRGWSEYGRLWRRTGGAKLAIIDSGIDQLHPDLEGKAVDCRSWLTRTGIGTPGCQDSNMHGTHVSGIAAAITDNGEGIAGLAFDAEIMALQTFNSAGEAATSDVAAAIVYAARNGAKVANYSFSAAEPAKAERDAVEFAADRGVVQVAAAGNTGERGVQYPARYGPVIAVSATNRQDELASYSTFGDAIDVAAPGTSILSTLPGGLYGEMSGTSMASPYVAGLAALLRADGLGPAETRRRIRESADDLGPSGYDDRFGHGRINAYRSLN